MNENILKKEKRDRNGIWNKNRNRHTNRNKDRNGGKDWNSTRNRDKNRDRKKTRLESAKKFVLIQELSDTVLENLYHYAKYSLKIFFRIPRIRPRVYLSFAKKIIQFYPGSSRG